MDGNGLGWEPVVCSSLSSYLHGLSINSVMMRGAPFLVGKTFSSPT
jgi:hypothetical protein